MRPSSRFFLPVMASALLFLSSCGGDEKVVRTYEVGSRAEIGHLIYTVFETQWLPQIGLGDAARVPKDRFFLVRLSVVNSGSETLMVPNLVLLDDQNNMIEELSNGDGVTQWLGYVRKVRPADSISGNIAFDAAPKHYRLRLTDEDGVKTAIVDIPLNFTSETPQLPVPGGGSVPDLSAPAQKK